ncbi:hypothetical protein D3C77_34780 [compost metagenome]
MVERTSQPFALDVQRDSAQGVNLGAGRFESPQVEGASTVEQALNGLLGIGGQLAQRAVDNSAQTAYLEGQRARMAGEAATAVESDIFSKPFVNGGYNTEDYRISQANMAREMKAFISTQGRSMTPQEFATVLRERVGEFMGSMENLPQQGKLQALTAQQKLEESLFAEQAGAYQQFVIQQGSQRFQAQGNQIITDMVEGGPAATQNAERAALFYTDLLTTDKLPASVRTTMAKDYLSALVNADQRQVVESLRDAGMLDVLSFKERQALDSALRESAVRTEAKDSLGVVLENAVIEGRVAKGAISYEDLRTYIATETNAGRMSFDQGKALAMKYASGLANKDNMLAMMQAIGNGNLGVLAAMGESADSALTKMDQQQALAGRTTAERMTFGVKQGSKLGTIPKVYGETIGQAVRHVQLLKEGQPMNEDLVSSLNAAVSALTVAEQSNPGARGVLLQSMPEDTRMAMSYALQQQQFGVGPADSLKEYAANREAFQGLNDIQKSLRGKDMQKLINEQIDGASSSGFWGRIGNFLTGSSNLSSNPAAQRQWSAAIQEEANYLSLNKDLFGATPESYVETAATNVKNRTIEVGLPGIAGTGEARRPLILPRGVTTSQIFGTTDNTAVGRKLAELYPAPTGDFETGFSFNSTMGYLEQVTFDKNGMRTGVKRIDATAVGQAVRQDQEAILEEARAGYFGAPVEVSGQSFVVDGANTQGLSTRGVYRFRKDLAGMEGLNLTVYKDADGLAVGMGHNVTGTSLKEGDTITKAQAERWFREDTDAALAAAKQIAPNLGVTNQRAINGLAGAAFQLGNAGLRQHERTLEAIRTRDFETFKKEVRSSDWAGQTRNRVEWFIEQMAPHFQELL